MKESDLKEKDFKKFNELDPEMKTRILSFLPLTELVKMRLVSKNVKELADDKIVWQERIKSCFPYLEEGKNDLFINDPKNLFKIEAQQYNEMIETWSWPLNLEQLISIINGYTKELDEVRKKWVEEDTNNYAVYGLASLANPAILEQFKDDPIKLSQARDVAFGVIAKSGNIKLLEDSYKDYFYYDSNHTTTNDPFMFLSYGFRTAACNGNLEIINNFLHLIPITYLDNAYSDIIQNAAFEGQVEIVEHFLKEIDPKKAEELDTLACAKSEAEYSNHSELANFIENYKFEEKPKNTP